MTTEIYAHLSDKHLHSVICMLPGPNLGTVWAQLARRAHKLEFIMRKPITLKI